MSRYICVLRDGHMVRMRDQETLRMDILTLLKAEGPMPKRRLMTSTRSTHMLIETALQDLLGDGQVEKYRAKSERGRIDEFWCTKGRSPAAKHVSRFQGAETLAAFQAEARRVPHGAL